MQSLDETDDRGCLGLQQAFHDQLDTSLHQGNRDGGLMNVHVDILFLIYRKNKNSFRERDGRKENPFADYAFSLRWLLGHVRVIEPALENWVASPTYGSDARLH